MVTLLTSLVLAPSSMGAFPAESVKLARTFVEGEAQVFSVKASMDAGTGALALDAEVVFKVKKLIDGGAQIAMSAQKYSSKMDGSDTGEAGPDELMSDFTSNGWPHVMSTENFAWIYILAAAAGVVPDKEVEVGKSFEIDWTSKDKSSSAKGKGKLTELVELNGKKAAKIEYEVDVSPSDPTPGRVKCITYVDRATSAPISCEGTVEVESAAIKFSVKRIK